MRLWLTLITIWATAVSCETPTVELTRALKQREPATTQVSTSVTTGSLRVMPATAQVAIGRELPFSVAGGVPPYQISVTNGSLVRSGVFGAPFTPSQCQVKIVDAASSSAVLDVMVVEPQAISPNDPFFTQQLGFNSATDADIDAPEAWGIQSDCSSVLIGVVDTGVDYTHPDLAANLWTNPGEIAANGIDDDGNGFIDDVRGWNFAAPVDTNDPKDDNLHGTHVTGTIAAAGNNGVGVAGVCWKAKVVPIKMLDKDGAGAISDGIAAIQYAKKIGVKVLNNSWGGGPYSANFAQAVKDAGTAGILFVAAAGNGGLDGVGDDNDVTPEYPASFASDNVISVAAVDGRDQLASFSNYGATSVHIAAPGVDVLSTFPTYATAEITANNADPSNTKLNLNYERISGTSMATPHVTAAAALIWSFNPTLSYSQVRSALFNGADKPSGLSGKIAGGRRLNLLRSLYPGSVR